MTAQKRTTGSDNPQLPEDHNRIEDHSVLKEPFLRPPDLHTLIRSRKESEKQLNLRITLLQAILEGADSAIFSVDPQCCYTSFNKKHARDIQDLYGSAITIGEKLEAFVPIEKDIRKIHRLIQKALEGEQGTLSDYFGDNARSRRYFDLSYYPIRNEAGIIAGAAFVATDTTLRKQSERHLSEQEERFRRLAENAPDLLYRMSLPEGRYEYISPSSLTFTGYPPEEFYQKPGLLYDLIHPSGKDAFGRQLELLIKGKPAPAAEFQIVGRNGDTRWGFFRTTLVRDAAGHPVAVEGIVTDITDRKKEQIALEETKDRYRMIVQSAATGIVLVDAQTQVIADANPRALAMIGASSTEVIGSACTRFFRQEVVGREPETDTGEQVHESERILMTADGGSMPVIMTSVPVKISGRDLLIEAFVDLSEQKKTEDALRQIEDRYQAYITTSSEGIFRIAADCEIPANLPAEEQIALLIRHGYIAECNDALATMRGYEQAKELAGKKIEILMDPEDPCTLEYLHKFIRDGYRVADYEKMERDHAGNARWFCQSMNGIVENGCVVHLWGVQRDITGRRNEEMTIRESEERYRDLVEHSVDIICTISCSGEITSVNPAVLPVLGYLPDELLKKNISDFVTPESRQRVQEEIDRTKNGARPDDFFFADLRAKDGRFIPFEVNLRIRSEGRKNPDIVCTAREISERKKSEDTLRAREECLRTLLLDMPSVAVQGFRTDYTVIFWNEASTRIYGYTMDEAVGKDIRELLIPVEAKGEITETCDHMAMTGIPGPSAEKDLLHKDGTRVPVFVSFAMVKNPGKSPILFGISVDLSERKKTENAVRDAERCLQSILDVAPFGTFLCELNDDGRLVFVAANKSAGRILGTDCSRYIGKTFGEAFSILPSASIPESLRSAARDGEPFHCAAFDYQTGGTKGVMEMYAVPLAKDRISVFFWDITDKKKAEDELRESETLFRTLIQNSSDIIQILDTEYRLIYTSPSFTKLLGYAEEEKKDCSVLDLVHPDDRDRLSAVLEKVSAGKNAGTPTEYRMLTRDGDYRYVESVGVNLTGIEGVDGIVIHTHSVHERKLAEQALSESEERFRLLFRYSNDAVYIFGITASGMPGKIMDANDMAVHQTSYAKDELVQRNLFELCSRDLIRQSRAIMMELLTRGEVRFETEKVKKDGALLPVEISARLAKIRDRTYIIATSRDISRRKREDRALRIANQKIQLMNIVAWHDIRNTVTGLRDSVELSKDRVMDKKQKKFMDCEKEVLRIIERQLQYTKEYQEMGTHSPQWVNLPQVLRMIVSFGEIGSLKFRMNLHDLELFCDPVIEKVFSHLIDNTRRHGERATEIHISCNETADGLLLIYDDDGVGIPQERKKELFVRGAGPATGFSLYFIHDILEISDMTIRETGEPGTGVRFEISVPRGLYRAGRKDT